jgi:hypothetical protein
MGTFQTIPFILDVHNMPFYPFLAKQTIVPIFIQNNLFLFDSHVEFFENGVFSKKFVP